VNQNNDVFTRGKWIPQLSRSNHRTGGGGAESNSEPNSGGALGGSTGFGGNGTGGFGTGTGGGSSDHDKHIGGDIGDNALRMQDHAASIAAAAATAAVAESLPPSSLVILSATTNWPGMQNEKARQSKSAQLLLYLASKLSSSLKCNRFCAEALETGNHAEGDSKKDDVMDPSSISSPRSGTRRRASTVVEPDGTLSANTGNNNNSVDTTLIASTPPSSLPQEHWSTADLSSFVVQIYMFIIQDIISLNLSLHT
jgi:hypothetical protein